MENRGAGNIYNHMLGITRFHHQTDAGDHLFMLRSPLEDGGYSFSVVVAMRDAWQEESARKGIEGTVYINSNKEITFVNVVIADSVSSTKSKWDYATFYQDGKVIREGTFYESKCYLLKDGKYFEAKPVDGKYNETSEFEFFLNEIPVSPDKQISMYIKEFIAAVKLACLM